MKAMLAYVFAFQLLIFPYVFSSRPYLQDGTGDQRRKENSLLGCVVLHSYAEHVIQERITHLVLDSSSRGCSVLKYRRKGTYFWSRKVSYVLRELISFALFYKIEGFISLSSLDTRSFFRSVCTHTSAAVDANLSDRSLHAVVEHERVTGKDTDLGLRHGKFPNAGGCLALVHVISHHAPSHRRKSADLFCIEISMTSYMVYDYSKLAISFFHAMDLLILSREYFMILCFSELIVSTSLLLTTDTELHVYIIPQSESGDLGRCVLMILEAVYDSLNSNYMLQVLSDSVLTKIGMNLASVDPQRRTNTQRLSLRRSGHPRPPQFLHHLWKL